MEEQTQKAPPSAKAMAQEDRVEVAIYINGELIKVITPPPCDFPSGKVGYRLNEKVQGVKKYQINGTITGIHSETW